MRNDFPDSGPPAAGDPPSDGAGKEPQGTEEGAEETAKGEPEPKEEAVEEPEVIVHAETPVPSADEIAAAMQKAFEGSDADPVMLEKFTQHALAVLEMNRSMNLTAIVDPLEVAVKHYVDSWRLTRFFPMLGKSILDLGTGAGFPGIPLAMGEPNTSFTMLDSTKKKVDFVAGCIEDLGLKNSKAVWARGEEYLIKERVDIVVMRAVSSVRENVRLLRKVRHSLKDLILLKGASFLREVRAAEREVERLGFKLDTVFEHELPEEMGKRAILVYRAPGGIGL